MDDKMWLPRDTSLPESTFLLQAWEEKFSPKVPETFRCKYNHIGLLVQELALVAGLCRQSKRWEWHLKLLRDELKDSLRLVPKLYHNDPALREQLEWLTEESSAAHVQQHCEILSERCRDTAALAVQILRTLPGKERRDILTMLNVVATDAAAAGFPSHHLRSLPYDQLANASTDEVLDAIIEISRVRSLSYRCVLFVYGDLGDLRALLPRCEAQRAHADLLPAQVGEHDEQGRRASAHPVLISLEADGPFQAAQEARARLTKVFDLFDFYKMRVSLEMDPWAYVWENSCAQWVNARSATEDVVWQRKNARSLTGRFLEVVEPLGWNGHLSNALDQFAVAQRAEDPRIRLIGIWSALESLTGGLDHVDVYQRVAAMVIPSVVWRRTERIARYLAISVHAAGGLTLLTKEERGLFPLSTPSSFSCVEMLRALSAPKDHPTISALLRASSAFPLLCNHIYEAWNKTHDPHELNKCLKHSRNRIGWHLARIYRARNRIIHHGDGYRDLQVLVRHLGEYFATTVTRVLHELVLSRGGGVERCFARITLDDVAMSRLLERTPHLVRVSTFIRPVEDAQDVPLYPGWPIGSPRKT